MIYILYCKTIKTHLSYIFTMRSGLLALGIIIFVLGAIFYVVPFTGTTATTVSEQNGVQNIFAGITIPQQLSLAGMLIGLLLVIIGIAAPSVKPVVIAPQHTRHTVTDEKHVIYEKREV